MEPDLEGLVHYAVQKGLLVASTSVKSSDVFLVAVPTPFKGDHEPDLAYVEKATRMILPQLRAGNLFIIESTSPVGTTEKMAKLIFKDRPELKGKSTSPIARNVFCRVVSFMNCSRTTG